MDTHSQLTESLAQVRAAYRIVACFQERAIAILRKSYDVLADQYEFLYWYRVPNLNMPPRATTPPWSPSHWDYMLGLGLAIGLRTQQRRGGVHTHLCIEVLADDQVARVSNFHERYNSDEFSALEQGRSVIRVFAIQSASEVLRDDEWTVSPVVHELEEIARLDDVARLLESAIQQQLPTTGR